MCWEQRGWADLLLAAPERRCRCRRALACARGRQPPLPAPSALRAAARMAPEPRPPPRCLRAERRKISRAPGLTCRDTAWHLQPAFHCVDTACSRISGVHSGSVEDLTSAVVFRFGVTLNPK